MPLWNIDIGVGVYALDGRITLLDVTVDEGGERVCGGVDLVLGLGHVQLAEKLLKHLDGLGVLGLDVLRRVRGGVGGSGSHVVIFFEVVEGR